MTPQQGNAPDFSKAGNSVRRGIPMEYNLDEIDKRRDACFLAMAGIAEPAQWVKAVEEIEKYLDHRFNCAIASDPYKKCDCGFKDILAKLTAARTGGKE